MYWLRMRRHYRHKSRSPKTVWRAEITASLYRKTDELNSNMTSDFKPEVVIMVDAAQIGEKQQQMAKISSSYRLGWLDEKFSYRPAYRHYVGLYDRWFSKIKTCLKWLVSYAHTSVDIPDVPIPLASYPYPAPTPTMSTRPDLRYPRVRGHGIRTGKLATVKMAQWLALIASS